MSTVFLHCWQRTEQHQENLQEQRCTTSARPARNPGPQHNSSQPSGANLEVPTDSKRCETIRISNERLGGVKNDMFICVILLYIVTITASPCSTRDAVIWI